MTKLTNQENMDLFTCLSVGGLLPEEKFIKESQKWIDSSSARKEALDAITEMIEIEESVTGDNRDERYIFSLSNIGKKILVISEGKLNDILGEYIEHYSFFDRHIGVLQ